MVWERLDDDGTYYTALEVAYALQVAQRLWCLLTLCLEKQTTVAIANATPFISMPITALVPLRVEFTGGIRLQPATLHQFAAKDKGWRNRPGTPKHYAWVGGLNLLALDRQPASGSNTLTLTYAAEPLTTSLSSDAAVPEIPVEQQIHLVDFAIAFLRLKEGGAEMQNGMQYFNRFLDHAQKYKEFMRSRSRGQLYDTQPFDLNLYDRGRLDIKLTAQKAIAELMRVQSGQGNGRVM